MCAYYSVAVYSKKGRNSTIHRVFDEYTRVLLCVIFLCVGACVRACVRVSVLKGCALTMCSVFILARISRSSAERYVRVWRVPFWGVGGGGGLLMIGRQYVVYYFESWRSGIRAALVGKKKTQFISVTKQHTAVYTKVGPLYMDTIQSSVGALCRPAEEWGGGVDDFCHSCRYHKRVGGERKGVG